MPADKLVFFCVLLCAVGGGSPRGQLVVQSTVDERPKALAVNHSIGVLLADLCGVLLKVLARFLLTTARVSAASSSDVEKR